MLRLSLLALGGIAGAELPLTPPPEFTKDSKPPKSIRLLDEPRPPGQQLLHQALLEVPGFRQLRFQRPKLPVHVAQDAGYRGLFFDGRERHLNAFDVTVR